MAEDFDLSLPLPFLTQCSTPFPSVRIIYSLDDSSFGDVRGWGIKAVVHFEC